MTTGYAKAKLACKFLETTGHTCSACNTPPGSRTRSTRKGFDRLNTLDVDYSEDILPPLSTMFMSLTKA